MDNVDYIDLSQELVEERYKEELYAALESDLRSDIDFDDVAQTLLRLINEHIEAFNERDHKRHQKC